MPGPTVCCASWRSPRCRLVALGLVMAGVAFSCWLAMGPPATPNVSLQQFRRLAVGMTEQDCDALLLGPAVQKDHEDLGAGRVVIAWIGENALTLDAEFSGGRLTTAALLRPYREGYLTIEVMPRPTEGLMERLRRFLGR